MAHIGEAATERANVALLFDYEAIWATQIQPQGRDYRPLELVLALYTAARRLGLTVNVIHPSAKLDSYMLILCPLSLFWSQELSIRIKASGASCVLGPRTGSKTDDFQIPLNLAPGNAQDLIPLVVSQVESFRPGHVEKAGPYQVTRWLEHCETALVPLAQTVAGHGIWYQYGLIHYLACWPDDLLLETVLSCCCDTQSIPVVALPSGLRLRQRGNLMLAINYEMCTLDLGHILEGASSFDYVIGGPDMPAAGVAVWRLK
ncbi:beta-galactosidase trimerization domain-containing protein [Candidatus Phycosocius spiralis]|uniref:Beta-galactosidase trimerisation domain-containing protein n=1 Tax=Candidatus Phycosocius spiralis TaxID=2815099 RepID=A0ABQ4PU40_9PROT|nr:beta-galactosidase trimerization domain-containing protein [Candidatus Phycosocius spiralis]GIU66505.1 hypothetical protein PsB1_0659 [Candidatus Phycosocius spiralis]